ncbi:MAG: NupC/NupG family nucleoside CNT transporter [Thermonemataceae bacterium]
MIDDIISWLMPIGRGVLGMGFFISIGFLFSTNRKQIDWRLVGIGLLLQITLGVLLLKVDFFSAGFRKVREWYVVFLDFSQAGATFIFGDLAKGESFGFIFAFQILPTIIFFSTVSAALYHLGVLQKIVYGIAWVMARTMRLTGPESLSAAGNIFLGQTEAPLLVRPFIKDMTRSELNCLMTGGMATLAGGVLAAYIAFLGESDAEKAQFATYLLSGSVMNAPAAIVMAKMLFPAAENDVRETKLEVNKEALGVNVIDAMSIGAADGLKLALNVGGMLLAFIAVIALFNHFLEIAGYWLTINEWIATHTNNLFDKFSLEYILGVIGQPIAWLMGVEWDQSLLVGSLIGQKTSINEFIAYQQLGKMKEANLLTPKSVVIATYALCGFSNFSSIAIQIGGIGGMAPERQGDLSKLGFRALLGASIACFMTATVVGMITL